jgi:hypothetical protein
MSQRDWWKGDLIASILLVLLGAVFMWVLYIVNPDASAPDEPRPTVAHNYQEATVVCDEWEETPWEVTNCKWNAYEAFYGTDAARAAYEHQVEAR